MNQEEADQYVADEVSEELDSRGEVMRSEKNDWQFLRSIINIVSMTTWVVSDEYHYIHHHHITLDRRNLLQLKHDYRFKNIQ